MSDRFIQSLLMKSKEHSARENTAILAENICQDEKTKKGKERKKGNTY